jgi:hypothetical protein
MRMPEFAVFLTWVLAGCDGNPTAPLGPEDLRTIPAGLEVVDGDRQRDTIGALLRTPIKVRLTTRDQPQRPLVGVTIYFVALGPHCGSPVARSAVTDDEGYAMERWELGDWAMECRLEARAVDADGTPRSLAWAHAFSTPGAPAGGFGHPFLAWVPTFADSVNDKSTGMTDRGGNNVPFAFTAVTGPGVVRNGWIVPTGLGRGTATATTSLGAVVTQQMIVCRSSVVNQNPRGDGMSMGFFGSTQNLQCP